MLETTVGIFDSKAEAEAAKKCLIDAGVSADAIEIAGGELRETRRMGSSEEHKGFMSKLQEFFSPTNSAADGEYYEEGLRRGSTLLSVTAEEEMTDEVAELLEENGAQDVETKGEEWRAAGWKGPSTSSQAAQTAEGETVPIIEEELQVGKRMRQNRTVRVYRRIVETPVEETVDLTDENVTIERQHVDRPATAEDLKRFQEGTVEMIETTEEPVVSKRAHVTEEIKVSKERRTRQEKVRDTVRKTEVEVQGGASSPEDLNDGFRKDFETRYGATGGAYSDYEPAYRFGNQFASDERYLSSDWDKIQPDMRKSWDAEGRGPWDKFKDAIRYGWDTVRGKRAA